MATCVLLLGGIFLKFNFLKAYSSFAWLAELLLTFCTPLIRGAEDVLNCCSRSRFDLQRSNTNLARTLDSSLASCTLLLDPVEDCVGENYKLKLLLQQYFRNNIRETSAGDDCWLLLLFRPAPFSSCSQKIFDSLTLINTKLSRAIKSGGCRFMMQMLTCQPGILEREFMLNDK